MSIYNEIIMIVTAASLGFSVATGINLTYFNNIMSQTKSHSDNDINHIPNFWKNYRSIKKVENYPTNTVNDYSMCVVIDGKEICIPIVE